MPGSFLSSGPQSPQWRLSSHTRRRQYWLLVVFILVALFLVAHFHEEKPPPPPPPPPLPKDSRTQWENPPSWDKLRQWERDLPQHNLDLPAPEGKRGRYVKFSNQIKMLGWNNVFNELLMNTHLAYESKRAYVFQDFVWTESHYPWPAEKMRENPPRTPLTAIISGPTVGGAWEDDETPRSVSEAWFNVVCPARKRRIINTREVKPFVSSSDGIEVFNHWKKILTDAQENCIEIRSDNHTEDAHPQTFDLWLWGSTRILSLWESFSKSPTSRLLGPSPIVKSAVDKNEYLFLPRGPPPKHGALRSPYDRMLAIHVRRGDFKESCLSLARWNSTFYSWNLLPQLPDQFVPPSGGEPGNNTPENVEKYLEHCLPTFDDIVRKIRNSRKDFETKTTQNEARKTPLDVVFLMTNEQGEWLDELKTTLTGDGWYTVVTSKDLVLDQEQTEVDMAVDMEIARRAAVFVGNGWSSFTSNIVHQRLVDGKEPISCRFY